MKLDLRRVPAWDVGEVFIALVTAALVAGMCFAVVWSEFGVSPDNGASVDWLAFGVVAASLLFCELQPRTWISGGSDPVTLLPLHAYALMLLGSPSGALVLAIVGSLIHSWLRGLGSLGRFMHVGRTMMSVAAGGLVLLVLGARGAITSFDQTPWPWAIAIVLSGLAVLVLDAVVTEITLATQRRISFVPTLRRNLVRRVTSVGSLLSLAPIWIIGVDYSPVLAPLLAITTVLVFASTRRANDRSREADHDPLTGLGNRRAFMKELSDSCRGVFAPTTGAVLLMDLDGFKEINDQLGHDVGDAVLIGFGERLARLLPPNSYIGRLGGDEFAVLLTWTRRRDDVPTVVRELHGRLAEPMQVQGFPISVGVSIGVALTREDGTSAEHLLRAADIAMYRAKRLRTGVERYTHDAGAIQVGRVGLMGDLGHAIERGEFRVDYQPQLSIPDGRVIAIEALVRWQHPVHGTIAPTDFIGLVEQTDLIGPLTDQVLSIAARDLREIGAHDVRLALNTSVRNLQDAQFASRVLATLQAIGFPPGLLELEVTESAVITKAEQIQATISNLRASGVRITLDGFGTGYASYQAVRVLNIERIKIDRDFVVRLMQDPHDRAIVRSLITLAHELSLEVVAEGVETDDAWSALAEMRCDAAQGYGIAMPMPVTSLWLWLKEWNRSIADRGLLPIDR